MTDLEKLLDDKILSVRSANACQANGLLTADAVVQYFLTHKTFLDLPNLGNKSNEELIAFCKSQKLYIQEVRGAKIALLGRLFALNKDQLNLLQNFIENKTQLLPKRPSDILMPIWEASISVEDFYIKLLFENWLYVDAINNAGKKTVVQVQEFVDEAKKGIEAIASGEKPSIVLLSGSKKSVESDFTNRIEQLNSYSFFEALNTLIVERKLFGKDADVAYDILHIYNGQKTRTLLEIAEENDISRERVRQKRNRLLNKLMLHLSVCTDLDNHSLEQLGIDLKKSFLIITNEICTKVNQRYGLNFSKAFIALTVYASIQHSYSLLGQHDSVVSLSDVNSVKDYAFRNYYSISNPLFNAFSWQQMVNALEQRLTAKVYDDYHLSLDELIVPYIQDPDPFYSLEGISAVKALISNEFGLQIDEQNLVVIPRNQRLNISQQAFRALEAIGHAAHLSEIHQKVQELFPDFDKDLESIRSALNRGDGFVPIGRQSLFGLQKWEDERDDFRGGTYRDIAIEYLEERNRPVHLVELHEYALKYRPSITIENLRGTLVLDSQDSFLFFNSNFIGLKKKQPVYDLDKYHKVPQQLTKKIVGKMQRGYDRETCIGFLKQTYDLYRNESINILKYIELGQDD